MNKKILKANNGISMTDVIIAIIILCMFVGVIGNLYYQISLQSNFIRLNTMAVYYTVKIAEDIDKMPYEEVTNDLNTNIKTTYQIPDLFNATIEVQNYNEIDTTKEDIIKIVTIKIEYEFNKQTKYYEIEKLKIKEK